jgi:hypothetical protein
MAGIFSDVTTDIQKLRQLKAEIENVKKALKSINIHVDIDIAKGMEAQLQSLTKQYDDLVKKISEAEGKIMISTKRINDASEKIIKAQEKLSKASGTNNLQSSNENATVSANQAETSSIQEQAKAYDELAAEIDGVLGTRDQNIRRMIEEQRAIDLIKKEIKELTKYQAKNSTLSSSQQKRLEQLNNSLLTHKAALSEVKQTLMNNAKLDNAASTSMNSLSQSLSRMKITYRELTEEERNSPFGKELLASINQADAKIKELDATIGNHQRNVGNYAKAYNGLNVSVQQIVRELPSAAMGLNMFFLAISNNLPILTDEIKRAKDRNAELIAQNQKATPVWKQLVSSIFSWQSAMMVGITLLTVYGKDIWEWIRGLSKAKEAIIDMISAEQEMAIAKKKASESIKKEQAELEMLYRIMKNNNNTIEQRKSAYAEFISIYSKYADVMDNEKINIDKLNTAYKELTKSIKERAVAESYMNTISDLSVKRENEEIKRLNQKLTLSKAEERYRKAEEVYNASPGAAAIKEVSDEYFNARNDYFNQQKIYDDIVKNIENYTSKIEAIEKHAEKLIAGKKEAPKEGTLAYLEQEKDILEAQLKSLTEIEAKGEKGIELRKKIADLDKRMEIFNVSSGSRTSDKGSKVLARNEQSFSQDLEKQADSAEEATSDTINDMVQNMLDGLDAEQEAMYKYLRNYGTFREQQQAITEEYSKKIAEAGGSDTWQGKLLQKEMEQALSGIDLEKLKQGINWELVFGDLDKVSKESLNKVKQQLKDFKNSEEYKNMAVDQKKVIDEALNNIQTTLIDKGGLLADLPEQLNELAIAQEELSQAQEEYNEAMKSGTDEQKAAATKKLNDAQKKQQNAENNVQKSADKARNNLISLSDAINELGSSSDSSLTSVGNLVSGILDIVGEGGDKISGIIGSIFSLLDNIGSQGLDGFIGNVVKSMANAAYGAWNTVFGWTGIDFGGESDPHLQEDLERLSLSNQDLINSLDNLADKMDDSALADATGIYEQQKENIEKQMANTQEMMQRSAAAYSNGFLGIGGTHSSNKKINDAMSAEDWRRISEAAGVSVRNASDFWNLTSEQMYNVANNATDLYSKIKQYADDGYQNASQYMDSYIEYWKQLEELEDAYREKLTDTSFDTVRDEFKNSLLDMESDAEDFAENFEKMMQQAVVESMMSDTYAKRLKDWYKNFANAMEGGELTGTEQADLKAQWDQMVSDALAERDAIMQAMGWDSSSTEQQSASSRGFGTEMTHEDAGELSGRFTAVYESNLRIEAAEQQQTVAITELRGSISALTAQASGMYNIADETRTILANSYLELQQIRENTGEIVKPIKQMQADIAEVKRNTSRL